MEKTKIKAKQRENNYTILHIKKDTAQRFIYIAKNSGIDYSHFLDRLMDESPFSNYMDTLIKTNERRKQRYNNGTNLEEIPKLGSW